MDTGLILGEGFSKTEVRLKCVRNHPQQVLILLKLVFFIRKNISLTKEKSTFGVDFFAWFRVFVRVP
jgi:hypothetical protein